MQNDILDKIQKLLRLADRSRGATEHEAKVALAKAEELMTRHKIDMASLRMNTAEPASIHIGKEKVDLPKTLNPADMLILSLLQSHFNIKVILTRTADAQYADLIGTPEDIAFASYAFEFLRQTFFRCWNEFNRQGRSIGQEKPNRKSYYRGLYDGVKEAIQRGKQEAEATASGQEKACYDLVLADTKAALAKYVSENYGRLANRRRTSARTDSESYRAGKMRGSTITVNRPLA